MTTAAPAAVADATTAAPGSALERYGAAAAAAAGPSHGMTKLPHDAAGRAVGFVSLGAGNRRVPVESKEDHQMLRRPCARGEEGATCVVCGSSGSNVCRCVRDVGDVQMEGGVRKNANPSLVLLSLVISGSRERGCIAQGSCVFWSRKQRMSENTSVRHRSHRARSRP